MWPRRLGPEHGGITYFVDEEGLPVQEYWHDMKFWWPQNEAIIATPTAYRLTGDAKYAAWHCMIHDWTYARFPDPDYGEWFGYLHRDGRLSSTIKGMPRIWARPCPATEPVMSAVDGGNPVIPGLELDGAWKLESASEDADRCRVVLRSVPHLRRGIPLVS